APKQKHKEERSLFVLGSYLDLVTRYYSIMPDLSCALNMQTQSKMDGPTENITNPVDEAPKDIPTPIHNLKTEPENLVSNVEKEASLEVCISVCKPNQELHMACLDSKNDHRHDDLELEYVPKVPEETMDYFDPEDLPKSPDEKLESLDDGQPSDDEFKASDDQTSSDSETSDPSSDNDSDFEPMEYSPKPARAARSKKRAKGNKATTTSTLEEKVKSLMTSNILSVAKENASNFEQAIPVSQKKDKAKALAEEVAKLPIDDQPQARKDATALIEDSKKFNPSASIVNMDWKLKAAAWMRVRESSKEEPNGGLLCDEMGLGKTLTVLTTIAHEKFSGRSKAPTLIIAPRSLITQWIDQISVHCVEKISKGVLQYYAGSRIGANDIAKAMQKNLIVITTYDEVCSSHPKLKPPVDLKSTEELEAWREMEYDRRAGPFHKVEWRRIILDEAHSIKNKDCATSIAVRALKGKFKWVMSGTPLHNGVEELYPYLHFIYTSERMEYETFMRKFSNGLDHILETVLHRSTYSTWILGKPIVTLPGIHNRVMEVELCSAEQLLYREIQELGIAMINGLADTKHKQCKCILAVITMLRMFVSHPLLTQKFLETVLNRRVVEELKAMAQEGVAKTPSTVIINSILELGDRIALRPKPPGDFDDLLGIYNKLIVDIRQEEGSFAEFLRRKCPRCEELVSGKKAFVVTSCEHVYCKGCFDELPDQDGKTEAVTRICSKCTKPIEEAGYSEKEIEKFGKDNDIKVMISSLKTGGVGLNLTMANKCILVDPWWNEAVQDQAYCRLYRIGQPRSVEYVQIVAKASIDRWMISLQEEKSQNIRQVLSTDSLKEILGLSGDIREEPNGGFSIISSKGNKYVHSWAQFVESGIIEEVDPSEEA
ncbi:uncharacterized protein N7479_010253, partial [Penicillium vulpinum]|uniref:uncharacterized protein n=1 Tax=Penicillium vulpinum TaxID=29845 RepID=UPI00254953F6